MNIKPILLSSLLLLAACSEPKPPDAPQLDARLDATIRDIMEYVVDPSGDFMFEAVAVVADEKGVTEKAPKTEEEWKEVRRNAFLLLEGMNLLTMEGRKVAPPDGNAKFPEVELTPEEIQKLIDGDREAFVRRARKLQDAAALALTATEKKDKDALFGAIGEIDKACEGCHVKYWYPKDARAVKDAKERGIE